MPSTLTSPAVSAVLDRLYEQAAAEDGPAKQRVRDREAELGGRLGQEQRYELYGDAPLAITREVGEMLYLLTVARRPSTVVEFGSSLGISTLFIAAALRDCGGRLITTELLAEKAEAARGNLREAGLEELVELRVGDARETLRELDESVELLFLDGRNDLYLEVLRLLEPRLAGHAVIAADLNVEDPDLLPYLSYVRDPANGYLSVAVPLDAGVELALRTA